MVDVIPKGSWYEISGCKLLLSFHQLLQCYYDKTGQEYRDLAIMIWSWEGVLLRR